MIPHEIQEVQKLLTKGLDADEANKKEDALQIYTQAAENCLTLMKNKQLSGYHAVLSKMAKKALSRGESIKNIRNPNPAVNTKKNEQRQQADISSIHKDLKDCQIKEENEVYDNESTKQLSIIGNATYTEEEQKVLAKTSLINGREYLPFISADIKERFNLTLPFTDKDGTLALSIKQQKNFSKWCRPEEVIKDPKIIDQINCFTIKQTIVSDCSFVASLAVCAQYERRFKKRVVTTALFPKNKNGDPIYNPHGKYMVKLNINGIPRKIIIDDYLPVGRNNELLCSFSSNRSELWVSLLEKAYMKVMGGYDFPGSNSNIDLHGLTGWIPERVAIRPSDPDFNKDALFRKLLDRFHKGDVLVTLATGEISDAEADRAGLVSSHAYAMLDIREVNGHRLFMLKNPWSHLRWRGRFSELDAKAWTNEMRQALNYNPENASKLDNGVFWIDYDSLCRFFDVFYLNWNPQLFNYTYCLHSSWSAGSGPAKDQYNIGENPQYSLDVTTKGEAAVWVLLTRHITEIADFKENKEFITLLVYKNTDGKKVYYPNDPPPFIDGVRINSPHYLCKIFIKTPGTHKFTLVVSQYEKSRTIYYTLRAYSTVKFSMDKLKNPFKHKIEEVGEWRDLQAGGCANFPSHVNNPKYRMILENGPQSLLIELKGPRKYAVGFDVIGEDLNNSFGRKSSGAFRSGFSILSLENVPSGEYTIIPSSFEPNQEGHFFLIVNSSFGVKLMKR